MTPIDTQALRAVALAATPGGWIVQTDKHSHMHGGAHTEHRIKTEWIQGQLHDHYPIITTSVGIPAAAGGAPIHMVSLSPENAAHIAAWNPAVAIALLDEREAMIAELDALRAAAKPAGEDRKKKRGTLEDGECARWIFGLILKINPGARHPNWPTWADDVRRLREIDGRAHREICEMFKWANGDGFWCANILSPKKLREKWDVLVAQRARPTTASRNGQPSAKFSFANADRSGDRRAQAATMARHGIVVPDGEVDL